MIVGFQEILEQLLRNRLLAANANMPNLVTEKNLTLERTISLVIYSHANGCVI